jgi:DNA polymerase elongation subunit (family B)
MTFTYNPEGPKPKEQNGNWIKFYCKTEREVIELTQHYFDKLLPDIISGWNIWFDVGYFQARARHLKIPTNFHFTCIFGISYVPTSCNL